MVMIPGGKWQTILNGLVDELIWDPMTGETLLIALDDGSLYAASYPDFIPRLMGNLGGRTSQAIWIALVVFHHGHNHKSDSFRTCLRYFASFPFAA